MSKGFYVIAIVVGFVLGTGHVLLFHQLHCVNEKVTRTLEIAEKFATAERGQE